MPFGIGSSVIHDTFASPGVKAIVGEIEDSSILFNEVNSFLNSSAAYSFLSEQLADPAIRQLANEALQHSELVSLVKAYAPDHIQDLLGI